MRKNLFIAAMAIMAMASCSKNEVIENQNSNNLINFKPYVANSVKAVDADITTLQTSGFNVYAWYNDKTASNSISSSFKADFFDGEQVTYTPETWGYKNPKYWPANGSLDFIAIGNNVTKDNITPTEAGHYYFLATGEALPTIQFKTTNIPAQQTDLLVSSENWNKTSTTPNVTFNFKHVLSKITVKVDNTTGLAIENLSVAFNDIKSSGTYSIGSEWTISGDGAINILDNFATETNIHTSNTSMIIIPQAITSMSIKYNLKQGDYVIEDHTTEALPITINQVLAPNTHYTFTITISAEASKIGFNATVNNWETGSVAK